jgi:Tol biopolymer transport system component
VAVFTADGGPGGERLRLAGNHWLALWHTRDTPVEEGVAYRIRVLAGAAELGAADVVVVPPGGRGEAAAHPLVAGQTLPVRFRVACREGCAPPALERVSVDSAGLEGNGASSAAAISADGRLVAFSSEATNLVPGDANGERDVFVHDRATGATARVSVASGGGELAGFSGMAAISGDGARVAFVTTASQLSPSGVFAVAVHDRTTGETGVASLREGGEPSPWDAAHPALSADGRLLAFSAADPLLVPGDGNWAEDVFVRDLATGALSLESLRADGASPQGACAEPSLSRDGRLLAFASSAADLVEGDANGTFDVFVRDRATGAVTRVSVGASGEEGNGASRTPRLSADGRLVAFQSEASNLVPGDGNGTWDVFVRDLVAGTTVLVSARPDGAAGGGASTRPSVADDGRLVAFQSAAPDLVPGDANGAADAFVRDLASGVTARASVDALGAEVAGEATSPALAGDGSAVAFASDAAALVPGDANGARDVFVRPLR